MAATTSSTTLKFFMVLTVFAMLFIYGMYLCYFKKIRRKRSDGSPLINYPFSSTIYNAILYVNYAQILCIFYSCKFMCMLIQGFVVTVKARYVCVGRCEDIPFCKRDCIRVGYIGGECVAPLYETCCCLNDDWFTQKNVMSYHCISYLIPSPKWN